MQLTKLATTQNIDRNTIDPIYHYNSSKVKYGVLHNTLSILFGLSDIILETIVKLGQFKVVACTSRCSPLM
jgi:hypothetical protein